MPAASSAPLRLAGYAGLFDVPDGARDTIRRGAFTLTLAGRVDPLPLLWQHRPDRRIGEIETVAEDDRGLRIVARIDRTNSRAAALLRAGQISGLSFGYLVRAARRSPGGRELTAIDLFEISLVTHPLQYGARVHLIA